MTSRSDPSSLSAERALADTHRDEWGRLVAMVVMRTRRLDLAEDAVSEAFTRAAQRWPRDGVPANPGAWLYTTASRAVIGRLRAEAVAGRRAPLLAIRADTQAADAVTDPTALPDDRLQLMLLCCHPALEPASRSALALRLVVGTSTAEIARLFNVPTPTMAARITRAKRKIVAAGIPLASPSGQELRERLDAVCRTVYLAFTAGYAPGSGAELLCVDAADDAVHLARVLVTVAPDAPQCLAMLALLMFQHARRDARVADGRLVRLGEQDRTLWRHDEIAAASSMLATVSPTAGLAEEFRLQAAAAREHCIAHDVATTDWSAIAAFYAELERRTGSPIVRLNRAIAVAEAEGPRAGLAMLDGLDEQLAAPHRLHATRGELARRAGDFDAARRSFQLAVQSCANDVERAFLTRQLSEVSA